MTTWRRAVSWTLSDVGSAASIVSLGLTALVYVTVREIRRGVLYKARAPELLQNLRDQKSALSTYLTTYQASTRDFQRQLAPTESTLRALESKVGWLFSEQRRAVRKVRLLVSRSRGAVLDENAAEEVYDQLTYLAEHLAQDWRDREWN